jgi:hypothetical protein
MSPTLYQQHGGAEQDTDPGPAAPAGSVFHLARLWPVMVWPAQKCRVCWQPVEQEDAVPYTELPVGWQHQPGECPT